MSPEHWIHRHFSDSLVFGGSGIAGIFAAVATEPAGVWLGLAALITAIGGVLVKLAQWYTSHKQLKTQIERLNMDHELQRREINRLRKHIIEACNESGQQLPVDLFEIEGSSVFTNESKDQS